MRGYSIRRNIWKKNALKAQCSGKKYNDHSNDYMDLMQGLNSEPKSKVRQFKDGGGDAALILQ
jgi:hypothetical protein